MNVFPLRLFLGGCVYLTDFAGGNFYSMDDRKRDRERQSHFYLS